MSKIDHCYPGDCRDSMRQMIADGVKVQMCVTSPPYFGLRDYGHPGQLGLEPTPTEYVAAMVEVFALVRDLLADDGTLWLNLGDSYANPGHHKGNPGDGINSHAKAEKQNGHRHEKSWPGAKNKDLIGIPWRVAFALQADGWVLRQEIIWEKPNALPESVTDRCTKSHEHLFLFAKSKWRGEQPGRFARISDQDARWLALLIDAEGSIVVKRCKREGHGDTFAPQVSIGNTSEALMREVVRIVGHGALLERPGKNCRMLYWQVANGIASDLLRRLYPFFIVKKRQARICIRVDSLTYFRGGKKPERKRRSVDELQVLESLWARNKECNSFGQPDLSDVPEPDIGRWVGCERYYWDAEAMREQAAPASLERWAQDVESQQGSDRVPGKTNGNMKAVGGPRSKRDSFKRENSKRAAVMPGQTIGTHRPDRDESEWYTATRNRRSVWTIATESYSDAHFATFPQALVEPCILAGSRPGDTVFDPFLGSGTVAQVAQNLGRHWLGCELNPEYIGLQQKRTAQRGLVLA